MNDIRAATVFTGLAVIIIILCIIAFVLFFMCRQAPINDRFFSQYLHDSEKNIYLLQNYKSQLPCRSSDVFKICGAMQLLSGLCLAIGKDQSAIQFKLEHNYPARALRALGLLLADGTPTGGRGEDFLNRQPDFFTETAVTPERKVEKSFPRWEINRHVEG